MEADNMQDKPNMDEMDPKNIVHDGADQDEVNHVGSVAQVQPDAATLMPKKAANLSSEKHFPFLNLPAEIRAIVYQCANTYDPEANRLCHDGEGLPSLWQPPITRVNRQIRQECLHIFYEMFKFAVDLNVRLEGVTEYERSILRPASDDQVSLQSFRETVQAFSPSPNNMLQISNLSFLSTLAIRVHLKGSDEELGCVGFHMASADTTNIAPMAVRGLDWNCRRAVESAWIDAAKESTMDWFDNFQGSMSAKLGYFEHRALVEEVLDLLCLFANHCPQLTRSVSLIYEGPGLYSEPLYDLLDDFDGYQDWLQSSESSGEEV